MKVASLLPSATEIVCALGLRDQLVCVTHECDFPLGVERLPHLTANLLQDGLSSAEIDSAVSRALRSDAHSIYSLDTALLHGLSPDVVLTQSLCEVCAVPTATVEEAVCSMPSGARIVSLDPMGLDSVLDGVGQVADALGVPERGREVAAVLRSTLDATRAAVAGAARPKVLAAEWLDPVYCGGHWLPEMIEAAGGDDPAGVSGEPSRPLTWREVAAADPDVIVLMPCGYHAEDVIERYPEIAAAPAWRGLRAVRDGQVYAVDATAYFSRPGPRVVEGTRILARILHPDRVTAPLAAGAAFRLAGSQFEPYL